MTRCRRRLYNLNMQTFLPYDDFYKVAEVLDNKRLNKQTLECYQILNVLSNDDPRAGWRNHPAVKMWRGFEMGLYQYTFVMVQEADKRGIKTDKNVANLEALHARAYKDWGYGIPTWFDNVDVLNKVTTTHKANLYNKDPEYYVDFGSAVFDENNAPCCEKCSYYWVTHVKD